MQHAQDLAERLDHVHDALYGKGTRALRQQRDQAVHTAHRLRMRLAETEVSATQNARLAAERLSELQVCTI